MRCQEDPQWWSATALIGGEFVAKFAWSRPAALHVRHELGVLTALARPPAVPYLPEVVVGSTDPLLLVTRRCWSTPTFTATTRSGIAASCASSSASRPWPSPSPSTT
jgi:hypothetical protein